MRKSEYNRTQDFYRAKSAKERLYYSAGIPSTAWGNFSETVLFQLIMYNENQILPSEQEQWYKKFKTTNEFNKPYLIFIGGLEDDHLPNLIAYDLMKLALANDHLVQITNSDSCGREGYDEENPKNESVFMLHNLFTDCTNGRVQHVRDWIVRHEADFRIITLGGDPSVFIKRCKVKPNVLLYVTGNKVKTRV